MRPACEALTEKARAANLVRRFELVADEFGGMFREYQGKAMPDDVYERFCRLRDERIPTLRAELVEAIKDKASPRSRGLTMLLTPANWFRSRMPRSNGCTGTATSQRCRSPRFGASCGLLKAPTASAKPSPGTAHGRRQWMTS